MCNAGSHWPRQLFEIHTSCWVQCSWLPRWGRGGCIICCISHTDIKLASVSAYEGGEGIFFCVTQVGGVSDVEWLVNGSSLVEGDGIMTLSLPRTGETLMFLNLPLHYNGTTVQCRIHYSKSDRPSLQSNTATLQVQGIELGTCTRWLVTKPKCK